HRSCSSINQLTCGDEVVVRVGQDYEAFLHEDACCLDELLGVRKKRFLVTDDFKLDPIREPYFARKTCRPNGLVRCVTCRRVGQNEHLVPIDVVEQRFFRAVCKIDSAHCDGHHVRTASCMSARHLLKTAVFAGAHDKA